MGMKFKFLVTTAVLAGIACSATAALAEDYRAYISGSLGWSKAEDAELDIPSIPLTTEIGYDNDSYSAIVALGKRFHPNLRGEIEVGYNKADMDTLGGANVEGEMRTWTGLLNAYVDIMPQHVFSPYLSAGLGVAQHSLSVDAGGPGGFASNEDTTFAWQVGAGATYDLNEDFSLQGGYRYIDTSEMHMQLSYIDHAIHQFNLGLIYSFN